MTLTLNFQGQMWNLLYLSQIGPLPRNEKQTYRNVTIGFVWPWPLIFKVKYGIISATKWSDCHVTKSKHIDWASGLKYDHQIFTLAITLTLNFQGQIWKLLYLNQKWSDCHQKEEQTHRLNSKPQMWPMRLTLTSAMTLTFEFSRSNLTLTFDHTHGFDQGFPWSIFEIAISQNGRTDWRSTKRVGVCHSWPQPWPFGHQGQV